LSIAGKKIILGVSGSIAAYKAAELSRLLRQAGAEVQVLMTPDATSFITPLTLATLTGRPALVEFVRGEAGEWNNHVELGLWADLFLLAPGSAQTIAKMAHGNCDNLLMATYLSLRCPAMVCPAMDLDMYAHASTQRNLSQLQADGVLVVDPEEGLLASGLWGKGRMAAPARIAEAVAQHFSPASLPLAGKKALVTAGPTHEYLDPVRYLTNGSTGKMGYAIAACLRDWGASVTLVSGPSQLPVPEGVKCLPVVSAQDMYEAVQSVFDTVDVAVFSAAVADYRPAVRAEEKMKKSDADLSVPMTRTPDIALEMGRRKRPGQINVGFALETHAEEEHALGKLRRKHFDLVVLNSLRHEGAGFGHDTNRVAFVRETGIAWQPLQAKSEVAQAICAQIAALLPGHAR
jgi:phosphopantothenoylcysteine decarboxylase/phosphopantothenate--cysteine ligase